MSWKNKLKSFLEVHAPSVLEAGRILAKGRYEIRPPRVTYAAGNLHEEIIKRFNFSGGIFLEVGANDGLFESNTAYLERYMGWRGILIEAVPSLFVECVRNRPKAECYHAALVPFSYADKYLEIVYADQMSVSHLSNIEIDSHVNRARPYLERDHRLAGQIFVSPAVTAMEIIERSGVPHIDLFSLDVEGAEMSVLEGIDFSRLSPKVFLIETDHPKLVEDYLNNRGYLLSDKLSHHDYLFRLMK